MYSITRVFGTSLENCLRIKHFKAKGSNVRSIFSFRILHFTLFPFLLNESFTLPETNRQFAPEKWMELEYDRFRNWDGLLSGAFQGGRPHHSPCFPAPSRPCPSGAAPPWDHGPTRPYGGVSEPSPLRREAMLDGMGIGGQKNGLI